MSEPSPAKFDRYVASYDSLHAANVAISGEDTDYFARYKVDCLRRKGVAKSARLLDFGCGIGNVTAKLVEEFVDVHGYEPSQMSAKKARERLPNLPIYDDLPSVPDAGFSAAMLSGVLHHVVPAERRAVMSQVLQKLEPGGRVFVFEHNPYNPLTRRAVSTCEFDDDAILLFPGELRRLLRQAGFVDVKLDYIVFFPKPLAFLRSLEPRLRWLFAGAQTLTIGTKPRT
jgi:SAM-dependent methyltransferase